MRPTRIRDYIMTEYICPICQKSFQAGSVPDKCPDCGCDKSLFNEISEMSKEELVDNISESLESSNNYSAEHTANGLAEITFIVGVVVGLIGVIGGIAACVGTDNGELFGVPCIMFGLLFFFLCLISWAFIKLLVNISYRLTRIDNKLNPEKDDKRKSTKKKA